MRRIRQRWRRWTPRDLLGFVGLTAVLAWVFFFGLASNDVLPWFVRAVCGVVAGLILSIGLWVVVTWLRARGIRRQAP